AGNRQRAAGPLRRVPGARGGGDRRALGGIDERLGGRRPAGPRDRTARAGRLACRLPQPAAALAVLHGGRVQALPPPGRERRRLPAPLPPRLHALAGPERGLGPPRRPPPYA